MLQMASRSDDLHPPGSLAASLSYQEMAPVTIEAETSWLSDPGKLVPMALLILLALTWAPILNSTRGIDANPSVTASPPSSNRQPPPNSEVTDLPRPAKLTQTVEASHNGAKTAPPPLPAATADHKLASTPTVEPFEEPAASTPKPQLVAYDNADTIVLPQGTLVSNPAPAPRSTQVAAIEPQTQLSLPLAPPNVAPPTSAAGAIAEMPEEITCFAGCDSARRRNRARASVKFLQVAELGQSARSSIGASGTDGAQDTPLTFNAIECIAGCNNKRPLPPMLPEPAASTDAPARILIRRGSAKAKSYSPN
jgi:hypothetical protein